MSSTLNPPIRIIDLSQPVYADCPQCPDDPPVSSKMIATHEKHGWQVEQLTLTTHVGSHLDAPRHRMAGGPAVSDFPLARFVGPAVIVDMRDSRPGQPFTSSMLSRKVRQEGDLKDCVVLLATGWGQKRANKAEWLEQSPFLARDGADWLVEQEIRGVGIDHYSIGGRREPSNSLTHDRLLEANIWILEDLLFPEEVFDLPKPVTFWGLPMNLRGTSGAPCRPVLAVQTISPH